MGHGLDVYVRNTNSSPMVGMGVEVVIDAFVCGGSLHKSTDGEGHAHFETTDWLDDSRELVFAGERWFGPYQFPEGIYSIRLD